MTFPLNFHFLLVVRDAAAGLGRDVDTHASSHVTLVYDDGEQSREQKVIKGFLMPLLENCGTRELVKDGGAATGLGPNVNTQCRFPL